MLDGQKIPPKKGIFCSKMTILGQIFNFYEKIELARRKTTQSHTFPEGIRKMSKIGDKKKIVVGGASLSPPPPQNPNRDFTQKFLARWTQSFLSDWLVNYVKIFSEHKKIIDGKCSLNTLLKLRLSHFIGLERRNSKVYPGYIFRLIL